MRGTAPISTPIASILLVVTIAAVSAAEESPRVVYYGWNNPSAIYVRRHSLEMEELPLHGTAINIPIDRVAWEDGRRDWSNQFGWFVFGPRRFTAADFATTIAELRATPWRRFTDNLLPAVINNSITAQDFSWFDEARWEGITQNWVVLLKIARRARCRGIVLDPEDYGGGLFDLAHAAVRHPAGFEAYQRIVRLRGKQLMRAGRRVFPDLTILALYGPSLPLDVKERDLATDKYGLWPAFVDGLISGADDGFVLIDGGERGYGLREAEQFRKLRARMEERGAQRLAPAAQRQVRIGFGLWIDHGGKRSWFPNRPERNYFTPKSFGRAVSAALSQSDGYIWIYSHEVSFFPLSGVAPDYIDALKGARSSPGSFPPARPR